MIAVTGANGLLGSYIVKHLLEQQRACIAIYRNASDITLLPSQHPLLSWRNADIEDPVSLEEAFKDVHTVIHAAAMVSFHPRRRQKIMDVNVGGTRNVVNACLNLGVKKLIHISSVAALGRQKNQTFIDENNKWVDSAMNSTYGESKYFAELEVMRGQEEGLDTVMLNPSVIFAAADWSKSSAKLFKYVWDEKPFFIDNHLNFVDVRDVASATAQLIDRSFPGERFILNAGALPLKEVFGKIATRFNKKAPRIEINATAMKTLAFLEGFRSWLSGSEPLITTETTRLAGTRFLYDNTKVKKALNLQFQTIDQTLDWCCEHYIHGFGAKN